MVDDFSFEDKVEFKEEILVTSRVDHFRKLTVGDIAELSISRDVDVDGFQVTRQNSLKISTTLTPKISLKEVQELYDEKYYLILDLPSLTTGFLKIASMSIDKNNNFSVSMNLEEI